MNMPTKNKQKPSEILKFTELDMLMILRIAITSIFVLFTIAFIVLIVLPDDYRIWMAAAAMILVSYVIIIALMIKLWRIKDI
jgi:hypothetical protein